MPKGYTTRQCIGCGKDALIPCRWANKSPLCNECWNVHRKPAGGPPLPTPKPPEPGEPGSPADPITLRHKPFTCVKSPRLRKRAIRRTAR